jgi:hypothetical protein
VLRCADLDAAAAIQDFAQRVGRQPHLGRRQQRAFDVVAQLLVALADLLPGVLGGFADAVAEQRQHAVGEVVEQGRGTRFGTARRLEEQRQVVLDAGRRDARLQVLHQRAAPGVDVEALAQRVQRPLYMRIVQRDLAAGQQFDAVDPLQRTLRFRIEHADRVDLVVEQFQTERRVAAHRIHVEQAAADGEIARVLHLRHVAVAGGFQPALFRIEVQALAAAQVETIAQHMAQRGQPLHQGGDRHHHDAALQPRQSRQRGQALADDVGMRAEAIVGQGFPVGEAEDRQAVVAGGEQAQVGFQLMRGVVVAGDHQQRAGMSLRGRGDRGGQRGAGRRRTPPGARLPAFRQGDGEGQRRGGIRHAKRRPSPGAMRQRVDVQVVGTQGGV